MNVDRVWIDDNKIWDCAIPSYPLGLTSLNLGSGPEPRVSSEPRPSNHGSVNRTRYWGPRLIELVGYVTGADRATRSASLAALRSYFTLPGGAPTLGETLTLRFLPTGETDDREMEVKVASRFDAPLDGDPPVIEWAITLEAPDPRMYGDLNSLLGALGGGNITVENAGDTWVPVVFGFDGAATTLTELKNVTTGEKVTLTDEISPPLATSDQVVIDTGDRTAQFNHSYNPAIIDASASTWFLLKPGNNVLGATGTGFGAGARLFAEWRDGWL